MRKYFLYQHLPFLIMLCFVTQASYSQKQGRQRIDSILVDIRDYKSSCQLSCLNDTSFIYNSLLQAAVDFLLVNPDSSAVLLNSAFAFLKKVNWQPGYGRAYQVKGLIEYNTGKYAEALKSYEQAITYFDRVLSNRKNERITLKNKGKTLGSMGIVYMYQDDYPKAFDFYNQGLAISKQINDSFEIATVLNNIGLAHLNKRDFANAIDFFNQSLLIRIKINDKAGIAITTGNMGLVYAGKGEYVTAIDYYFKAFKMDESLGNADGISRWAGNLGLVYQSQKKYEKAETYFLQALKISEDKTDRRGEEIVSGHLGNLFLCIANEKKEKGDTIGANNNYTKSLNYYLKASKLASELGLKSHFATWIGNVGNIYQVKADYGKALQNYFEALKISESTNDRLTVAIQLGNIGYIYYLSGTYAAAEKYLLKALAKSDSLEDLEGILEVNQNLSKLYEKTSNYKNAFLHYKNAMSAKDSLFNSNKIEEFTRKELAFEQEKKDVIAKALEEKKEAKASAEIERQKLLRNSLAGGAGVIGLSLLLIFIIYKRKRDADQVQKETSLSLQVSETEMKALRSQMNPHFIFNALQSIQTFLLGHQPDDANTYLLKFSKLMRLVLENSQYSEVPLKEDMQALELYMQLECLRLPQPFTYQFHIGEDINIEQTTIPPLILQPFVENAIWHGLQHKSQPGHIDIHISKRDNALYATVEDNGVGRHKANITERHPPMKKESLGMKLTEERLNILNELKNIKAQFRITDLFTKNNQPAGTKVELSLPLAG